MRCRFLSPFPPAHIFKDSSYIVLVSRVTFPKTKLTDDSNNQYICLSVVLHPIYLTATRLPSTTGLLKKTAAIPSRPRSATDSAFLPSFIAAVIALKRILGTPKTTNHYTHINSSEPSTRPPLTLPDTSDFMGISSSL